MTTKMTYNANEIISKANAIIRDANYTKLVKTHNAGQCQLVMAGPNFSIYISLVSNSVFAVVGSIVYILK